eukprot:gb/GFBE01021925.1/.p1 GENE.gb/GFBE01021925.1/~~gb/GFBE01021925.1/.p1  ORF type:complete len:420 (+),score=110.59 gb/GFBE01021925.1/:1-1260(+)
MKATAALLGVAATCPGLSQALLIQTSSAKPACNKFYCPDGFVPKIGHHELNGDSAEECCDETCGYWVDAVGCGEGYLKNEEYYSNVGKNDQICCDKQCGDYKCKAGYVLRNASLPGIHHSECCVETCALWNCTDIWATDNSKLHVIGASNEECCAPTCAQYDCQQSGGPMWFAEPSKNNTAGASVEECCMPQCRHSGEIQCQDGWRVPASKENETTTEGAAFCCDMTCKAYNCSAGWEKNMSRIDEFGDSDEACCSEQCSLFTCNLADGWANDSALDEVVGKTSEVCCQATCKQHTCNITEMWLAPGNEKENVTGNTHEVCCEQSCLAHTCAADKSLFPPAKETIGSTDEVCCEDARCERFRSNLTAMGEGEFCNKYDKDACESHYFSVNSTLITCSWDKTYELCRYDTVNRVVGCYGL